MTTSSSNNTPAQATPSFEADPSRRAFLRRSAQFAFTGAALPTALNLAALSEAAALNAPDGSYKALVCVFLYGANDHYNTVVAYDAASHAKYQTIRTGIALPRDATLAANLLTPNTPPNTITGTTVPTGGFQYALNPVMTGLAGLFNSGKAAVQLSVGPMTEPLTRTQFAAQSKKFPPKLFSHNDQQSIWQSSESEGSTVGWGGNIGDLALPGNGSTGGSFTCVSVTGNAVFLAGDAALSYQVSTGGAVRINSVTANVNGSATVRDAMSQLVQQEGSHVLAKTYNAVTKRAIQAQSIVNTAISDTANAAGTTPAGANASKLAAFTPEMLADNPLAAQLKMVARMIAGRKDLGNPKRQVFLVSLGGFDLHDNLIMNHPGLLTQVSEAMTAFYESTVALRVDNQVTSFTASDFGRTLTSNGDGSDHGWASHHFIVGSAVNGKAFYGYAPPISVGNTAAADDQWHVGQGRLLPTTSVDQYAATLASWFGVTDDEMTQVLPNINNFNNVTLPNTGITFQKNLGFMKTT
jgi:uncharacterized protein (DUF1501 family)